MTESHPAPRRLVRTDDGKLVAGVCSGLGRYFDLDPVLFRIGFVLLGPMGLFAYAVLWLVVPADPAALPAASDDARPWLKAAVIALVALVAAPVMFGLVPMLLVPGWPFSPGPPLIAILLAVAGILLLRRRPPGRPGPPPPAAPAADPPAPQAATVAPPPRPRSALTPLTLAAAFLAAGTAALLSIAGAASVDVGQTIALALAILGAGLVVGAWFGRARLLIPIGAVLVPVVLASSLVDMPPGGAVGDRHLSPTTTGSIEDVELVAGNVTLNLTAYDFSARRERASIRVGAGRITVLVPAGVYVDAALEAGAGHAILFDASRSGLDIDLASRSGDPAAGARLDLDIEAGIASVHVYRSQAVHESVPDDDPGVRPPGRRRGSRS